MGALAPQAQLLPEDGAFCHCRTNHNMPASVLTSHHIVPTRQGERGQRINRRGVRNGASRRKATPIKHIIQQLLLKNEVLLPYLQPYWTPSILLAGIPHQPDLC